jgi:hypothetical protein
MRAFLTACLVAALVAVAAAAVLNKAVQQPVKEAFATSAVRL